jgi:glutathione S-transferase
MTIIVHHLENSRSQRILWLLEELEIPYEVRRYARDAKTMLAPPELKRVHPLGKSPLIEDAGLVIAETGAIVEYLVVKGDGRLGPPAHRDAALRWRHFLHYAEGSLMPPLLVLLVLGRLGLLGRPARPFIQRMLDEHLDWLEAELATRLVCRQRFHRRRRDDELSIGSRPPARRARRETVQFDRLAGAHPRPPRLWSRARTRRTLQLRLRVAGSSTKSR